MLAKAGFEVTATDGAETMIQQTVKNVEEHGVKLAEARMVDWLNLHDVYGSERFDAVLCLGNAFTHLFDHEVRRDALRSMAAILKPGGLLIVDHRNYDDILDNGYSTKHRYYYTGHGVDARPVDLSRTLCRFEYTFPNGRAFHLSMYPLKQAYMQFLLEDAGLVNVMSYGDFERPFERYQPDFIQQVGLKPRPSTD